MLNPFCCFFRCAFCQAGLLLVFLLVSAHAAPIRLQNRVIEPERGAPEVLARQGRDGPLSGVYLLQTKPGLSHDQVDELQQLGVQLLRYIPEDAWLAECKEADAENLRSLNFVTWFEPYTQGDKTHRDLLRWGLEGEPGEVKEIQFLLSPRSSPIEKITLLKRFPSLKVRSRSPFGEVWEGTMTPNQMRALVQEEAVLWAEPRPRPRLWDEESSKIVGGDDGSRGTPTVVQGQGFDGSGVTVSVVDSGLDGGTLDNVHPDLQGRVRAFFHYGALDSAADEHGHGSHVTGIIAGDAATGETDLNGALYGLGVAPGVEVVAQRIFDASGNYTLLDDDFQGLARDAVRAGAEIGSNSWGDDTQGRYDLFAAEWDALVRDADELTPGDQPYILEFSAGNAGPGRQTIGTPAVAKNVIATGASQNNRFDFFIYAEGEDAMADFSSRGPAQDGRIKPDVVAPGTWIASLQSPAATAINAWLSISAHYQYQGGTSQAGPHVSGAAAIFVQYYRETQGTTPSPALVKAALINSSVDMDDSFGTGPIPNFDEGWGRVDLTRLIEPERSYDFTDQTEVLETDEVYEKRVVIDGTGEPLKVTLAYTDVPAVPAAIPALVNDLDLEVVGPDGRRYLGNQFDAGESVPDGGSPDRLNNVEAVHISNPLAGDYLLRVRARRVVEDARQDTEAVDQDFALVVSGDVPFPGVGILVFNQTSYTAPASIRLRLIDFDLGEENTVAVLLRSDSEPGGEMLELQATGTPGVFSGEIATAPGPASPDGVLQITHGDQIIAEYEDASPAATRTTTSRADLVPPVPSGITVTNRFGKTFVSWSTDEPARSTVRYGQQAPLEFTVSEPRFKVEHEIVLTNLVAGETYRFTIENTDVAGNRRLADNNGEGFPFVPQPAATVLLVNAYLDPDGLGWDTQPLSAYTQPMDTIGVDYEIWLVDLEKEDFPTAEDLKPFSIVVWRVAEFDFQTVLRLSEQETVRQYLDQGGGFFLASMEVLSRIGNTPFRTNTLQVLRFNEDVKVPAVRGIGNDPISSGIDMNLDYSSFPEELSIIDGPDFSDTFTSTTNAAPILFETFSGEAAGLRYPKVGSDSAGRVVFFSFPIETIPLEGPAPNNRANIFRNVFSFLAPGLEGLGTIALDREAYTVPGRVTLEVGDEDLKGEGATMVRVTTESQPEGLEVELQETVRPGLFRGFVVLADSAAAKAGQLAAVHGDVLRAEYFDASAQGVVGVEAEIDTVPAIISNVTVTPGFEEAFVRWETSKPADGLVQFGESVFLNRTAFQSQRSEIHELRLPGLLPDREYVFQVVSRDAADNVTVDDNQGELYKFRTLVPESIPWTEDFESGMGKWRVANQEIDGAVRQGSWQLGQPNNGKETTAHSPPHAWGSNLDGGVIDLADSTLASPAIDLTGVNRATLRFWHSYDFIPRGDFDIIEVGVLEAVTQAGQSRTTLLQLAESASQGWEETVLDLTPFTGGIVQLEWSYGLFTFESVPRPGWLIDDIQVTGENVVVGTIAVSNNLSQAGFSINGPTSTNAVGNSFSITNAPLGEYQIQWEPVPFYTTPALQTVNLQTNGQSVVVEGDYTFTDMNNNAIADGWEENAFGTVDPERSWASDSDGDGLVDGGEFVAGTDPTDSGSLLEVGTPEVNATGKLAVQWSAQNGRAYRVVGSQDLKTWLPLTEWVRSEGGSDSVELPLPADQPQFLRLEVKP